MCRDTEFTLNIWMCVCVYDDFFFLAVKDCEQKKNIYIYPSKIQCLLKLQLAEEASTKYVYRNICISMSMFLVFI